MAVLGRKYRHKKYTYIKVKVLLVFYTLVHLNKEYSKNKLYKNCHSKKMSFRKKKPARMIDIISQATDFVKKIAHV